MAAKYWIKLYHEVLHDPKMGKLPDNLWRRVIELFLLAGETDQDGILPDVDDMAWTLRLPLEQLELELEQLQKVNIVSLVGEKWVVTKFSERQAAVSPAERMKRMRDRNRKKKSAEQPKPEQVTDVVTRSVTKRNTDTDTDTDTDKNIPKGSGKPQKVGPKTMVRDTFLEKTKMVMPHKKSEQNFWWGNFGEMVNIAGGDGGLAAKYICQAVDHMLDSGLTIGGPESIIKTMRAIASGQKIGDTKNGTHSSSTRTDQKQRGSRLDELPTFDPYTGKVIPAGS